MKVLAVFVLGVVTGSYFLSPQGRTNSGARSDPADATLPLRTLSWALGAAGHLTETARSWLDRFSRDGPS